MLSTGATTPQQHLSTIRPHITPAAASATPTTAVTALALTLIFLRPAVGSLNASSALYPAIAHRLLSVRGASARGAAACQAQISRYHILDFALLLLHVYIHCCLRVFEYHHYCCTRMYIRLALGCTHSPQDSDHGVSSSSLNSFELTINPRISPQCLLTLPYTSDMSAHDFGGGFVMGKMMPRGSSCHAEAILSLSCGSNGQAQEVLFLLLLLPPLHFYRHFVSHEKKVFVKNGKLSRDCQLLGG